MRYCVAVNCVCACGCVRVVLCVPPHACGFWCVHGLVVMWMRAFLCAIMHPWLCGCMQTHNYTQIGIIAGIDEVIHTTIHANIRQAAIHNTKRIIPGTHACTQACYIDICIRTYMHTRRQARMQAVIHTERQTHIPHTCICIHTLIHDTRTCTHTCERTYL